MIRLLHFLVQPVFVDDDGTDLTPLDRALQEQVLTLAGLRDMVERWPQHLASVQAAWDAEHPPEGAPVEAGTE